jgi:oxygen-independent coproporphyrinogen-3 oxidase
VGFNRMSMGVQDFNERVQEAVNRVQPESMTRNVYTWAKELGFTSINVDLIYGLPFQTSQSFENTVRKVIDLSPDRVAVFNYAHVPWLKPHQKLIRPEDLPTPEQKLDILKMTIELLCANGYDYIGMDHFAKPDDELARAQREKTLYRNFQGYSTKSGADLYGFGMSSIRKFVIMRLMCDLELDTSTVERLFGISFDDYFSRSLEALGQFVADGLVKITPGTIRILGAGRLLLRNIAMCFDAYLDSMTAGKKPVFSRTV